jgi:hypothetical protein
MSDACDDVEQLKLSIENLLRSLNPELDTLAIEHPIESRLKRGLLSLFVSSADVMIDARKGLRTDWINVVDANNRLGAKIESWLESRPVGKTSEDINESIHVWTAAGFDIREVVHAVEKAEERIFKRPRGRPVTKRALAVKALDKRTVDPTLTWAQLADEVCDCGQRHQLTTKCCQSLRQEVMELEKFLQENNL